VKAWRRMCVLESPPLRSLALTASPPTGARQKAFSSTVDRIRITILALLFLFLSQPSFAQTHPDALADPQQESRAVELQKQLRCLVCQGQSLDTSDAPLAADLRHFIRVRIASGQSDDQIKQELVARYGDVILMEPPLNPGTYLLWFGPFLVLILCGSVVAVVVARAREKSRREN
jgi:cytochrome c-type biogenesis protein CcmH